MEWLTPGLKYTPSGPIYPLVISYLAQLHGFLELASRGLFLRMADRPLAERQALVDNVLPVNAEGTARVMFGTGVTPLIGDPSPASLVGESIAIDVSRLAISIFMDSEPAIRFFNAQSAGALTILAWEHTERFHTREPIWEFLRHLRNAAAHGGRFHFIRDEPRKLAAWRTKVIDRSLESQSVFAAPVSEGFLGAGDVLHLLADIDARYIAD